MKKILNPNRRKVLVGGAAALTTPYLLSSTQAYAKNPVIKVGYVSPVTGPLAGFAEADDFVLEGVNALFSSGVENNGKKMANRGNFKR